ncbi:hypothetical protein JRQ81_013656 [Phrynocephalus forsythii]|uniref:RING-type E3 ubiquitin transferase n=1 Tax=Phrynocephalus forsythii TaxID=171643 RepID=A0A9Q1B4Y6_9SAUR|nr:hypothetical protein JRQ81_013656 [Phrynocephalus forsythii]
MDQTMGQEAGKPTWPKPAGGYQTITGRRYGRRHAYVNFRPSLTNQERNSNHHGGDCEGLELDDVQKENSLCSSPLPQVCSALADVPLLENVESEDPFKPTELSHAINTNTSMFSPACYYLGDSQTVGSSVNSNACTEYSGEHSSLSDQNGIAFVNIDSYEPDSSDGEEEGDQSSISFAKEEAGLFQETLDSMLFELEKGVDSLSDLQSHLSNFNCSILSKSFEELRPVPFRRHSSIESSIAYQSATLLKPSGEEDPSVDNNLSTSSNTEQEKSRVDPTVRTQLCNVLSTKGNQENSSELVVRPKVRKQNPVNQLDRKQSLAYEEEERSSTRRWNYEEAQKKIKNDIWKQNLSLLDKKKVDDSAFWDDFEECSRNLPSSNKDEEEGSSECSDGEWSTYLPSYFDVTVKDQSSSDESWETLPGKEEPEPEVQSDSSGVEEEPNEFGFQAGEQTCLEDGEIPWLQYHEDIGSSSDEETDQMSHFVHPGFFMLDGNNNLEDDSSMSEDLDVEWRLLDEFGDGLGVAQAISYVDPQFLTYVALEERLAQAMETALAHLESLAIDVEQAHPPASKESIDCLPQIIITEDHSDKAVGQEQCCAICCSEYIKEEIVTELPCHHYFHKPCITLWLQKSGTCPVCRHVLASGLPEADTPTVLPDQDSPPSVHSTSAMQ